MNIVFDNIIFSKEKQGGISNYWFQLIKNYAQKKEAAFYEEKNAEENIYRRQLKLNNVIAHPQMPMVLARLAHIKFKSSADSVLYHSSFYRQPVTDSKVCEVTTIHDFLHNKFSSPLKKTLHNRLKYATIKRAKGIICVSGHTLKDLRKYCPPKTNQKVAIVYNGVSDDYQPMISVTEFANAILSRHQLDGKFLLYVGARSSYKNFAFVIELLRKLPSYKLAVVGNALTDSEKKIIGDKLMSRIAVANNIANEELNVLYNHAQALVYPSSYEGFGIPVIEAMKAGCPVLALNNSSIPEVAGEAAKLFEKLNIQQFVQEISQLENNNYRNEAINLGLKNAKKYSWNKCVQETTAFYQEVYQSTL